MGRFAFNQEPDHRHVYRDLTGSEPPGVTGLKDRWDMPVVRHRGALQGGQTFTGVDHCILTYHVGGVAVRRVDPSFTARHGGWMVARSGAVSLQLPHSPGQFQSENGGLVDYAHFYCRWDLLEQVCAQSDPRLSLPTEDFFGVVDRCLQRDMQTYLDRAFDPPPLPSAQEMDQRAALIIHSLLDFIGQRTRLSQGGETDGGRLSERTIGALRDYIAVRICEPIPLEELAGVVGLSPSHFARTFKNSTGQTAGAYVMAMRLERAQTLLRGSDLPISTIAFRCGFSSQAHLTRRFSAAFGLPPGRYRAGVR